MKFKVHESYKIRHKILAYLYEDQYKNKDCDKRIGSIEISEKTKIPIDKIHKYHEILMKDDEIDCIEKDGQHSMKIMSLGRYAYLEEKYIKNGWTDLWDYWFQPLKVIVPLIALIVSSYAIWYNSTLSDKIKKIANKVEKLEIYTNLKEK